MRVEEIPLLIDCLSSPLIGILHKPAKCKKIGIVIVPAGGPQYRVGCARQLITWSRRLAHEGYPVLRVDYRGFGDSAGEYAGFEQIDDDIKSAIDISFSEVAELNCVVLWGECNAASSIMMYAWQDARVKALILQNPWVRNESTQAKTYIKHYYIMRIMQKSFWLKLATFQFNPFKSLFGLFNLIKQAKTIHTQNNVEDDFMNLPTFQDKMREGLGRFNGKLLIFMSGYSLIGKEFDQLVSESERWQNIISEKQLMRIDEPEADHTFSRSVDRDKLIVNAIEWLAKL